MNSDDVEWTAALYAPFDAAAALLIPVAWSTPTDPRGVETRARAQAALHHLHAGEPVGWECCPQPLEGVCLAVAELLMTTIYSTDRKQRRRVAGLLAAVCREAGRVSTRVVAA